MDSNSSSTAYQVCDLGKLLIPLWAPILSPLKISVMIDLALRALVRIPNACKLLGLYSTAYVK